MGGGGKKAIFIFVKRLEQHRREVRWYTANHKIRLELHFGPVHIIL